MSSKTRYNIASVIAQLSRSRPRSFLCGRSLTYVLLHRKAHSDNGCGTSYASTPAHLNALSLFATIAYVVTAIQILRS
jgi:hypothetical protein